MGGKHWQVRLIDEGCDEDVKGKLEGELRGREKSLFGTNCGRVIATTSDRASLHSLTEHPGDIIVVCISRFRRVESQPSHCVPFLNSGSFRTNLAAARFMKLVVASIKDLIADSPLYMYTPHR